MGRPSSYIDPVTGELKRGRVAVIYNYVARCCKNDHGRYERLTEPRTIPLSNIAHHVGLPWAFAGGNIAASNRPIIKLIAQALVRLQRLGLIEAYPCGDLSVCVRLQVTPETLRNRYGERALVRALEANERNRQHGQSR